MSMKGEMIFMVLVKTITNYKNNKGELKKGYNFYLIFDNGRKVPIKQTFKDNKNDYYTLLDNSELINQ